MAKEKIIKEPTKKSSWSQGILGYILLGMILLAFMATGGSYLGSQLLGGDDEHDPEIASFGGEKILAKDVQRNLFTLLQNRPEIEKQALKNPTLQKILIRKSAGQIWQKRVLLNYLDDSLSMKHFSRDIPLITISSYQSFQDEKGVFSPEKLSQFLLNSGASEEEILHAVAQDKKISMFQNFLYQSSYLDPASAEAVYSIYNQTRSAKIYTLSLKKLQPFLKSHTNMNLVKGYYESSKHSLYTNPEKYQFSYAVVSAPSFTQPKNDEELRPYYSRWLKQQQFTTPSLLLKINQNSDSSKRVKAVKKALLEGKSLESLVFRFSDDKESLGEGGVVSDWNKEPKPVVLALGKLSSGSTTKEPIKTQNGYYFLQKGTKETPPSFKDKKNSSDILAPWRLQKKQAWLNRNLKRFHQIIKKNPNLQSVAKKEKLHLTQTAWLNKGEAPKAFKDSSLFSLMYQKEYLGVKVISEPILMDGKKAKYALVQWKKTQGKTVQPFSSVKNSIVKKIQGRILLGYLKKFIKENKALSKGAFEKKLKLFLSYPSLIDSKSYTKIFRFSDEGHLAPKVLDSLFEMKSKGYQLVQEGEGLKDTYHILSLNGIKNPSFQSLSKKEREAFLANPMPRRAAMSLYLQIILRPYLLKNPLQFNQKNLGRIKAQAS